MKLEDLDTYNALHIIDFLRSVLIDYILFFTDMLTIKSEGYIYVTN